MKRTLAPEELEEVIPSDAEEILHHGHVPPRLERRRLARQGP